MAKQKTKRGAAHDMWSDQHLAEKPAKNSEAVRLSERWVRTIRTYTKVSVWSFPVTALLLLVVYSGMEAVVPPTEQVISNQVDSAGKSAAIIAENAWISATPSPLVGGKIVAWNGFDVKPKPKVSEAMSKIVNNPDYTIEIHHFTLTDSQGLDYSSDVAVAVSAVHGSSALGTPSLTPIPPAASGWASNGAWYGLKNENVPAPVTAAIESWSKAYTSGNPTVLGQNVQDPKANHGYVPLTGVDSVKSSTVQAGSVPIVDADGRASNATPATLIVQVQLEIVWATGTPASTQETNGNRMITYDLLIHHADTASPVVVAWGGAGSGTTLTPYSNAVIDRKIEAQESK